MSNILWASSVFLFIGVWAEVFANTGFLGLLLGWLPGFIISFLWLSLTGRLKHNKGS